MIPFIKYFSLRESLDNPYPYTAEFQRKIVDVKNKTTGAIEKHEIFEPEQLIKFTTETGIPYVWKANRGMSIVWDISFGVDTGGGNINIKKTGTGDAFRIFATVVDITNKFITSDKNKEIRMLLFTSKDDNRTKLYKNRLSRLKNFELLGVPTTLMGETEFMMQRKRDRFGQYL